MQINNDRLYKKWKENPNLKKWTRIVQVTTGNIAIWPKACFLPIVIYDSELELKKDIEQ